MSSKNPLGIKIFLSFFAIILLGSGIVVAQKYPFGVKHYKTLNLGIQAAEGAGTLTSWAPPDDIVPESTFYVYALGDEPMCIGAKCGMGGYFIECLGGWLSGYKKVTEEFDYGLRNAGVDMEKQRIVTIADRNAKIIGIYPGARIRNLPYIMRKHKALFPEEDFRRCSDMMPGRWQ